MVEVFKTNVRRIREAKIIVKRITDEFPEHKVNFDLSDCDRILRIQGKHIIGDEIISIVNTLNYTCEILE